VCVRDPLLVDFLRGSISGSAPSARLYPGTPQQFTRLRKKYLEILGVPSGAVGGYAPASLRAGGATWLYSAGMPIGEIMWLLRHEAEKTARHYIQAAGAAMANAKLSSAAQSRLARVAEALPTLLRQNACPFPAVTSFPVDQAADEPVADRVTSERRRLLQLAVEATRAVPANGPSPSADDCYLTRSSRFPESWHRLEGNRSKLRAGQFPSARDLLEDVFAGLVPETPSAAHIVGTAETDDSELRVLD